MEVSMLKLEHFPVGPLDSVCVIVWNSDQSTAVIVDSGGDADKIIARVKGLNLKIVAILHTHAHFDHIGATRELQDNFQCPAYFHEEDRFLLDNLDLQTAMFGGSQISKPEISIFRSGDVYHELKVIHTPGHTPGSCCLLGEFECGPVLLSGDTLFRGGAGRTDLWGGSSKQLELSLDRISSLGDSTTVIPGHGPTTTVGNEILTNPYMMRRRCTPKLI